MTKGRRAAALLLLAAALILALLGQFYFFRRREYLWDGLVFHVLAAICFLLAWRQATTHLGKPRPATRRSFHLLSWLQAHPAPAALLALSLFLSLLATLLSEGRAWNQATGDVVAIWLLAVAAVILAALWPRHGLARAWRDGLVRSRAFRLRDVRRESWIELATLAGLTLLALVLRLAALADVPFTVGGDEAWHGLLARQVIDGQLRHPFVMGYMSMPAFFYWPISWSLRLVGDSVFGLRLPAALIGAATVPILYLFARRLWGRRTAVLAVLFLAGYDYHVHYSRLGANNVWDTLFVLLTLWALDEGVRATDDLKKARAFMLTGVAMGLSVYFYTGARLLPILVAVYLLFLWVKWWLGRYRAQPADAAHSAITSTASLRGGRRTDDGHLVRAKPGSVAGDCFVAGAPRSDSADVISSEGAASEIARVKAQRSPPGSTEGPHWRWVVLLLLAFAVTAGPMLSYALTHSDDWNARLNQVGIIQSGWLEREPGLTGKSTLTILADQFLRAAGAFHVYPDRTMWYGAERPLLDPVAGVFALLGMAWALLRWRDRRYFLVLIWFWSVILSGGMLTESPPSSQRLVIAIPAVALLVAFGLQQTVRLARWLLRVDRRWENFVLGLLVLVLVVSSVRYYFAEYSPSRRYGTPTGESATMLGYYLAGLEGERLAYLFAAPQIYWKFGTMDFLAPDVVGVDVVEPLTAPPDFVTGAPGSRTVFIFFPNRQDDLAWVQEAFPGGQLQEFRDAQDRLRFRVYEIP